MKPFQAIKLLTRQSKSKNFNSSPSYLFYETTKGFNYRTVDGMCSQQPNLSYAETTPDAIDDKSGQKDIVRNLHQLVIIQSIHQEILLVTHFMVCMVLNILFMICIINQYRQEDIIITKNLIKIHI